MISMDEAQARNDERLRRAGGDYEEVPAEALRLMAVGTNVNGVELEEEIARACVECLRLIVTGEGLAPVMTGMLVRTFWLGFEYGREEGGS